MRTYISFNLRFSPLDADQFRANTLDEVKAYLLEEVRKMKARTDISEENREYWLNKFANAIFVERLVVENEVQ